MTGIQHIDAEDETYLILKYGVAEVCVWVEHYVADDKVFLKYINRSSGQVIDDFFSIKSMGYALIEPFMKNDDKTLYVTVDKAPMWKIMEIPPSLITLMEEFDFPNRNNRIFLLENANTIQPEVFPKKI